MDLDFHNKAFMDLAYLESCHIMKYFNVIKIMASPLFLAWGLQKEQDHRKSFPDFMK